jgi:hypothetical protein
LKKIRYSDSKCDGFWFQKSRFSEIKHVRVGAPLKLCVPTAAGNISTKHTKISSRSVRYAIVEKFERYCRYTFNGCTRTYGQEENYLLKVNVKFNLQHCHFQLPYRSDQKLLLTQNTAPMPLGARREDYYIIVEDFYF